MCLQAAGMPHWDESRDWEGWWLGKYLEKKKASKGDASGAEGSHPAGSPQ